MKSMTGYASQEIQDENISLSVEIKGYNSRFLDLFVNLPPFLSSLEREIRDYVAGRLNRGKVEVNIRVKERNSDIFISVNHRAAKTYYDSILDLAGELGLPEKPGLALLLGMEGVLEIEKNRDDQKYRSLITPLLQKAVDQFEVERVREGKHTQEDILGHIAYLEEALKAVSAHVPVLEASIQENLKTRFAELLGDRIDENRILAETAVLLMKYTISEELSRLSSHLAEFRSETERNPSPGKKLDFLCQEINREVNTIGSKTPVLEVSRAVVDMKNALENIREQLRNIE
ncbi:YicC/YloC family endoribonuclease [Treponema primitia]|uniref:YicC/YloC family endoribonuclease n=1 Tax=Treponema primitia TaxID=88058 RepID=UPI00025556B1|nr:YicC/YloC family endoribonuclease [Treponema primitia]